MKPASTEQIPIDLARLKFSRYGSWMAFALEPCKDGDALTLKSLLSGHAQDVICVLQAIGAGGDILPVVAAGASPASFRCDYEGGAIEGCFATPAQIRLRVTGGLRVRVHWNINENNLTPTAEGNWRFIGWNLGCKFRTNLIQGTFERSAQPHEPLFERGLCFDLCGRGVSDAELMIERYLTEVPHRTGLESFDEAPAGASVDFADYLEKSLPGNPDCPSARALAAYVNWSATVLPEGCVTRPAMLMSNNWMRNIWNWDTFFNVMALSVHQPDLAWESVRLFFDNQAPDGQLPGYINNSQINFTRPQSPMQGWAMGWILEHSPMLTSERIAYLYPRMERLLDWWFTCRDDIHSGFPYHLFPSDSGWDHCTALYQNCPNQSPDVTAELVLLMETLGKFARILGRGGQAREWEERARALSEALVARFWDGRRFRSPHAYTGKENPGDSLHNYRPVLLGHLLPQAVAKEIARQLGEEGRFLTPHGLATESLRSQFYVQDGYWRGAIWAPTMFMFVDGLRRSGQTEFARELAGRFCRMCEREGFSENFNATTGKAVRDPAYTWTSSVYFILSTYYCL